MTSTESSSPRWRVTAKGQDSRIRDVDDPHWDDAEAIAAHRWVDKELPGSAFGVERFGERGQVDDVIAEVTVEAEDALAAEATAKALLDQALPIVSFTEFSAVPTTDDHVQRYPGKCSFCGKGQGEVKKLVAAPGAAICDECVERLTETMQYEFPSGDG